MALGVSMTRRDALRALEKAVEDMWSHTSLMMLMLVGDEAMTKPRLERAIRGALDAKNAADNARALIAQEGGE